MTLLKGSGSAVRRISASSWSESTRSRGVFLKGIRAAATGFAGIRYWAAHQLSIAFIAPRAKFASVGVRAIEFGIPMIWRAVRSPRRTPARPCQCIAAPVAPDLRRATYGAGIPFG